MTLPTKEYFLVKHQPLTPQFRRSRRAEVSGAIVVHVSDGPPDLILPDAGAEGVASWIAQRPGPGSYHTMVDSDSIIHLVPFQWEAYGEATGGNRWALHLSIACRADGWADYPPEWVDSAIRNAAAAAWEMSKYVHSITGEYVPERRITSAEYRAGVPGFISHARVDPGRRTDPGRNFPWEMFFRYYRQASQGKEVSVVATSFEGIWQKDLTALSNETGLDSLNPRGVDGDFGNNTYSASHNLLQAYKSLRNVVDNYEASIKASHNRIDELRAELRSLRDVGFLVDGLDVRDPKLAKRAALGRLMIEQANLITEEVGD